MSDNAAFRQLMSRVRSGDEQAAAELFEAYEPQVRRIVRVRLTDPGMRRQIDSEDVAQSVMADFFARVSLGQYDLESPEEIIKLLATMAKNRFLYHVERQRAARRDIHRQSDARADSVDMAAPGGTPSQIVMGREILSQFRARLTDEEKYLADQRAAGRGWDEIAKELGSTPDSVRMRLNRALNRVAEELGFGESIDDRST